MRSNIFDQLSFLSLFLIIALLPFFFLPFSNIPIEVSKGLLLVVGLAFCVIFWAIARFLDGKIVFPKSACLLGGGGIVLAFFLSAFFSQASSVSFFGTMFDIGTFWFILAGFLLMSMSAIIFRDPKRAKILLFGAILSGAAVLIFQSARLFIPKVLSLGILVEKTDNLLGSWNSFGIFAGFFALMLLLVVEFFPTTRVEKLILQILITLSVALIAAVNFPFIWGLLGVATLIIFVYKISITSGRNETEEQKTRFPIFSFSIIMTALLFFTVGNFIGGVLPNRLGLSNAEVSPSFGATMLVAKSVLRENPVFGIGPNKFGAAWSKYKPVGINSTAFWNVSFSSGSGLLPTFAATTGYLGILSWLVFFVLLIINGVKSVFSSIKNGVNWETMAFFILSLYLFISCFFYSSGAVIFLLAMALSGVFIGLSASNYQKGEISVLFLNDHRKSFFSILFLILITIFSAAILFKYLERLVSVSYFRKALSAQTVPIAEASINKALNLYVNDLYLRAYTQVYLVKLDSLMTKEATSLLDAEKTELQTDLGQAVNGAKLAAAYNPTNYLNFETLGSVYQVAGSLGVKDAYASAIEEYKKASALNPFNPGLKLIMANIFFNDGKIEEAKDYAGAALFLKPDYFDALIILSQIARKEGNNVDALSYAEGALSLAPTDKDLIKYVDSLKNSTGTPATVPTATIPNKTKK